MVRVYYINYIDPPTGFLKREEFDRNRDMDDRITELKGRGITRITSGSFERE